MKSLRTLIKLSKQELDGLRKDQAIFLNKIDELEAKKQEMDASLTQEIDAAQAAGNPDPKALQMYIWRIRTTQENIDHAVAKLEEESEALTEKIQEAFAEQKRYELLLEKKEQELEAERNRKEAAELDEIGIQQHYSNE